MIESGKETLALFIQRRKLEIEQEEGPLLERLALLRTEKAQLNRAAMVAGTEPKSAPSSEPKKRGPKPQENTIKRAVIEILTANGHAMTALDILNRLNERNGTMLLRSSLSPQLSRLKYEGVIKLTDKLWHLPEQKIETSGNDFWSEPEVSKPNTAKDREAGSGGGG